MIGLSRVELMSLTTWEANSKGTDLRFALPFEALCCPCVTSLSNVEGGGLLADGQT
jgi:hypothetical protein